MRRSSLLTAVALCLAVAAPARAEVAHTIQPGETLWSIAAANNLYTSALASYNGLSEDTQVVLGSTIMVPTESEALAVVNAAPLAAAPQPPGAYTVRFGDTLSGLAAVAGVPLEQMAAMNGLDPAGMLVEGTQLKLPTGSPAPVVAAADPVSISTRLDAGTVASVAAEHGVAGDLAAAIAWQESGFNNAMVSGADAHGVMQVIPGTWSWIQDNLATTTLDPASATDNVAAGSLYLRHLLEQTGGDEATAIAGYYQGLSSVQRIGMLPETERYVANVQALRGRF